MMIVFFYRLFTSVQIDGFVDFAPRQPASGGALKISAGAAATAVGEGERPVGTLHATAASSAGRDGSAAHLLAWDASIKDLCLKINAAVEAVGAEQPQLLPK